MGKYKSSEAFEADCRRHFDFLVKEYGFTEYVPAKKSTFDEYRMMYYNDVLFVEIEGTGYGAGVCVGLGRRLRDLYELREYSVLFLLAALKADSPLLYEGGLPANADQPLQLRDQAKALRQWGGDLLRGDFTIWAAVRKVRWRGLKKRRPKSDSSRK